MKTRISRPCTTHFGRTKFRPKFAYRNSARALIRVVAARITHDLHVGNDTRPRNSRLNPPSEPETKKIPLPYRPPPDYSQTSHCRVAYFYFQSILNFQFQFLPISHVLKRSSPANKPRIHYSGYQGILFFISTVSVTNVHGLRVISNLMVYFCLHIIAHFSCKRVK